MYQVTSSRGMRFLCNKQFCDVTLYFAGGKLLSAAHQFIYIKKLNLIYKYTVKNSLAT